MITAMEALKETKKYRDELKQEIEKDDFFKEMLLKVEEEIVNRCKESETFITLKLLEINSFEKSKIEYRENGRMDIIYSKKVYFDHLEKKLKENAFREKTFFNGVERGCTSYTLTISWDDPNPWGCENQ